ncbi:MAG: YceI family protein [Woeseiaceae bacterium]|nr:YceI family protein [Woeseiaceae bacterium]
MRSGLLIAAFFALVSPAQADEWHSTENSRFEFETTFEGVATPGEFTHFLVVLDLDPASPDINGLRVTVDLTAADMGDPDMNAVLYEPAWFDTEHFAVAEFESGDIVEQSPGRFLATGMLDLKGTSKLVAVPFLWTRSGDTASMLGELLLDRTEFDVGSGEWASDDAIGINVKLMFAVQLELRK